MKWRKTKIETDQGLQEALAPVVISASRRTDIPAFYPEWLANRLKAGRVKWINPYSGRTQYISFEHTRAFVFWTKNPEPFFPVLKLLEAMSIGCYFQYTLNDYSAEGLEPGLPPIDERIRTFRELSGLIGAGRIIWRFDPLIITGGLEPDALVARILRLTDMLQGYTRKFIFSFAEIEGYPRVRRNLDRAGVTWRNFSRDEMLDVSRHLRNIMEKRGMRIAACAQEIDLQSCGVRRSSCVDPELLATVAGQKPASPRTRSAPLLPGFAAVPAIPSGKDPGQRNNCGCSPSRDIGQYNTCAHGCLYCYANSSAGQAAENAEKADPGAEGLPWRWTKRS